MVMGLPYQLHIRHMADPLTPLLRGLDKAAILWPRLQAAFHSMTPHQVYIAKVYSLRPIPTYKALDSPLTLFPL